MRYIVNTLTCWWCCRKHQSWISWSCRDVSARSQTVEPHSDVSSRLETPFRGFKTHRAPVWSGRNWTWWRRPPPAGSLQTWPPRVLHCWPLAEWSHISPPARGRRSAGCSPRQMSSCSAEPTAPAPPCWRWWCSWSSQSSGWSRDHRTGYRPQLQRWWRPVLPHTDARLFSPSGQISEHWTLQVWSSAGGPESTDKVTPVFSAFHVHHSQLAGLPCKNSSSWNKPNILKYSKVV